MKRGLESRGPWFLSLGGTWAPCQQMWLTGVLCVARTVLTFKIWTFPLTGGHPVSLEGQGLWQHSSRLPTRQAGCHLTLAAPLDKVSVLHGVPPPVAPAHSLRSSDSCWLLFHSCSCFCLHSLLPVFVLTSNPVWRVRVQILDLERLGSVPRLCPFTGCVPLG